MEVQSATKEIKTLRPKVEVEVSRSLASTLAGASEAIACEGLAQQCEDRVRQTLGRVFNNQKYC